MKKVKENSENIFIQLEFNFCSAEKNVVTFSNVRKEISLKYTSHMAKIINLNDKLKELEKKKEIEITNYILNYSKRF